MSGGSALWPRWPPQPNSETTGPIATKRWWNSSWMAPFQNYVRWSRLPTKMATKLKIEKGWMKLKKNHLLCNYWANLNQTLGFSQNNFSLERAESKWVRFLAAATAHDTKWLWHFRHFSDGLTCFHSFSSSFVIITRQCRESAAQSDPWSFVSLVIISHCYLITF